MYKVLLVDDEPLILRGLRYIIDWAEYGIEIAGEAKCGMEALKILEKERIDILLTDLRMPDISGIDLIRFIKQNKMNTKCIILSGFDDFQYTKEAIKLGIENYLLKPVNEDELSQTLINTVSKIEANIVSSISVREDANILRSNILYRWITDLIDEIELSKRASFLGISLNENNYLVCLVKILDTDHNKDRVLRFAINNIINESIESNETCYAFVHNNDNLIVFFSGRNDQVKKTHVKLLLEKSVKNINNYLKMDVFITIGSITHESNLVHTSYLNANMLLDYAYIYPPNSIIDYDEIKQTTFESQKYITINFDMLKYNILNKKEIACIEMIDHIYSNLYKIDNITPSYVQNISVQILYHICSAVNTLKTDINNPFNYDNSLFKNIFEVKSKGQLSVWIKDMIVKAIAYIEQNNENMSPLINRVINYISINFSEDLSLKSLSASFKVNTAHLGQLFKNETGEMFSDYVAKFRIEKAKGMLLNSNLTINEIAHKVGYFNSNYFSSVFKKMTGESPLNYKRIQ